MQKLTKRGFPVKKYTTRVSDYILHLIFPDRCLFCRDLLPVPDGVPLCNSCQVKYTPPGNICPGCERPCRGTGQCSCIPVYTPLQTLYALSNYDQQWRLLLHDLKYRNRRSLARPLGVWLAREIIAQKICRPDLVVPVPLHRAREKERGFNQSALVALHAARILDAPCRHLLIKMKDTVSQTTVSRQEREKNVSGVFSCKSSLLPGSVVLLLDDVYSTGSTMKEAAAVLSSTGALVHGAVISYNPRNY